GPLVGRADHHVDPVAVGQGQGGGTDRQRFEAGVAQALRKALLAFLLSKKVGDDRVEAGIRHVSPPALHLVSEGRYRAPVPKPRADEKRTDSPGTHGRPWPGSGARTPAIAPPA